MGINESIDLGQDVITARRTADSIPTPGILTEHAAAIGRSIPPRVQTTAISLRRPRRSGISGLVIVNSLIATRQANSLWVLLLNILRHQADPRGGLALVAVTHNVLAIIRLTNRLNVILEPLIGEERRRLRGGRG